MRAARSAAPTARLPARPARLPARPPARTRALPPDGTDLGPTAIVRVYGDQELLPRFFQTLARLGCAPPSLPGDVSPEALAAASDREGARVAACLSDLQIPTPLEQAQILSALDHLGERLPIAPIESAVFRVLLAHDVETFAKLMHAYETYLAALSDMRELVEAIMRGA